MKLVLNNEDIREIFTEYINDRPSSKTQTICDLTATWNETSLEIPLLDENAEIVIEVKVERTE